MVTFLIMQEGFGIEDIEANNTAHAVGAHNDTDDCHWRIIADYACEQWRYDQKPLPIIEESGISVDCQDSLLVKRG